MKELKAHPIADVFPKMPIPEFNELSDDIKLTGLQHPIILYEGKILDGRHRYHACLKAGIKPITTEYKGDNPLALVVSLNLRHRFLTVGQRAMIAAKLANLKIGRPKNNCRNSGKSQTEAAETLGISRDSVTEAARLAEDNPELAESVANGSTSLNEAVEASKPKPKKEPEPEKHVGKDGYPIPVALIPLWDRAEKAAEEGLKMIVALRSTIRHAAENKDPIYRELRLQETEGLLDNLFSDFKLVRPHAVCTACSGRVSDKCILCKGRGFMSAYAFKMFADHKIAEMRVK